MIIKMVSGSGPAIRIDQDFPSQPCQTAAALQRLACCPGMETLEMLE
ncbi:MAG: hypothetical protein K8I04_07395 [Gammaproteobacteria bacterium]|nr:hypothetical protein [Gammaproteobacteria bacterium]